MNDSETGGFPRATPARPMLGLTVLVVEDSIYASDAMRLLVLRSGARLRRADSIRAARRHLQVYRPTVLMVDLGLPDGNGCALIAETARASSGIASVIAMSGDPFAEDMALAAGAHGFLDKPITSLAAFQSRVLATLPKDMRPYGLRALVDQVIEPDTTAYLDDLTHVRGLLTAPPDPLGAAYVAQMIGGVARSVRDDGIAFAADTLADAAPSPQRMADAARALIRAIDDRLDHRIAV